MGITTINNECNTMFTPLLPYVSPYATGSSVPVTYRFGRKSGSVKPRAQVRYL